MCRRCNTKPVTKGGAGLDFYHEREELYFFYIHQGSNEPAPLENISFFIDGVDFIQCGPYLLK